MKINRKSSLLTILITISLLVGNISMVLADDDIVVEPTIMLAAQEEGTKNVEIFQDNENTESIDFKSDELPENWVIGGDAELTGDGTIDEEGDGWLRLTEDGQYETGYAVNDEALPTENGLAFTFDYASWGGSGADGITFFLIDGETEMEDFNVGGTGGSLGYAPRYTTTEGISNAYVGIGLDEFGNFSNSGEGRDGGTGREQDSVSVRGSGNGYDGYEFIDGTDRLPEGIDTPNVSERPDQDGSQYRNVSILFQPVDTQFTLTLNMVFGANGEPQELLSNLLLPGVIPGTIKFGFAASSGGATNFHEIRNVVIDKAVVETIQEELAQEQTTDFVADKNDAVQENYLIPVNVIKTNDKLTIIPVTGSELYDLKCGTESRLDIEDQVFEILPSMCGYKGSLELVANDTLPTSLPVSFSFIKAVSLTIIKDNTTITTLEAGKEIEIGFYLDENLSIENLAILTWESGKWVEKDIEILNGTITTSSSSSGLFVLVEK